MTSSAVTASSVGLSRVTADDAVVVGRKVTKRFARGDVLAVDSADFHIDRGEFVSIVGPSGCGKSTLLRLIAGLIPVTSGTLEVHGRPINGPRAETAMMFQQPTLLPWKSAIGNVLLPRKLAGRITSEARNKARELLAMLGLSEFADAYPQHLSGGMQQRVALARTLITGADLFLMDEPFAALDEFTRERLNMELLRIQAEIGATIVFVTHNINEAVFLADRVFVMTPRPGRLADVIDVPLPEQRSIDLLRSAEFNDTAFAVRGLLGET
jgi:NitT/TauT family transport system ATP-binding protein